MIFKLILLIVSVVFLAFFTGLNISNTCDIWLFVNLTKVPVFLTVLISFAAGILFTLPAAIFIRTKKANREALKDEQRKEKELAKARAKAYKHSKSIPSTNVIAAEEATVIAEPVVVEEKPNTAKKPRAKKTTKAK